MESQVFYKHIFKVGVFGVNPLAVQQFFTMENQVMTNNA